MVVGVSVGTEVGDGTIEFGANVGATTVDMKAIVAVGLGSGIIVGTSCPGVSSSLPQAARINSPIPRMDSDINLFIAVPQ